MATTKEADPEKLVNFDTILTGATIVLEVPGRLFGSIPKDMDLIDNWIATKGPQTVEGTDIIEETVEEKKERISSFKQVPLVAPPGGFITMEEASGQINEEERVSSAIRHDKNGNLAVADFQIKALIGQAAQTTMLTTKVRGLRPNLREGLQIRPQLVPFYKEGSGFMQEPHGNQDFVGHVMTMQGKRSILRRCEFLEGVMLSFDAFWVKGKLTHEYMKFLVEFGGAFLGLYAQRRFEAGKFRLVSYNKLENVQLSSVVV